MPLILAIEPDRRQAHQIGAMVRGRLHADLVLAASAEHALIALGGRVPDLILVPALLSPKDETALSDHLRARDAASAHVQTLTIPILAAARPRSRRRGVLASLKRKRVQALDGCDPREFAEQCATYLQRAAAERARRAEADADAAVEPAAVGAPVEGVASIDAPTADEPSLTNAPAAVSERDTMERDTIEIDLSTLLDELSAPDPPAPIEIVAGEMPPVMPVVPVVEDPPASPVAPVTAVEWTPVWLAPGRLWPPMKGVTVESAIIPQLAPPRAVASTVVPRTPRVQGKPIQDEWGFFDPARCGFAALLSKLDEITEGDERPVKHGA